ncbi:MAG: Gfo/Idh/MocA family oxidoreductase [Xanthomonadales bacterium]|nr:Gfo/Idh/MocA family oxidoreductase [Gammaproteobacteria bacterium]NNK05313.1 Gfo/Idh/MocA family oxidoreductase [Xanthomonadales bacterium]
MSETRDNKPSSNPVDSERRELLKTAGAAVLASTVSSVAFADSHETAGKAARSLRWGIVGTGGIANSMAPMIQQADFAELGAVSSRKMASAEKFAAKHSVPKAFDSWAEMCKWDGVDAIYVATPTSVREEICIAAANHGKHVLGEKPFANLASVKRITAACAKNGVGFMDGTHFVHHPRSRQIKSVTQDTVGWPWSIASAFQFSLTDKGNIRFNPELEPYGAIGDAGWYNMKAAVEFSSPGIEPETVEAFLRRDEETGAAVSGSGVIVFSDGSTTTWNCGFESGAGIMDLRISGAKGVIKLDDFLGARPANQPADFEYRQGWNGTQQVEVPSPKRGAALMFEDFAHMVGNPELLAASIRSTERTQEWLDAIWNSALGNERKTS